jgi:hypothetical protein
MARTWLWIRYGLCTCLGLALIGLAAVSPTALDPEGPHPSADDGGGRG